MVVIETKVHLEFEHACNIFEQLLPLFGFDQNHNAENFLIYLHNMHIYENLIKLKVELWLTTLYYFLRAEFTLMLMFCIVDKVSNWNRT